MREMREAVSLLREAGFEITKAYYSIVDDLTYTTDAEPEEHLRISSFKDLVRIALKKPIKLNILRLLAYPIVKLRTGPKAINSGYRDKGSKTSYADTREMGMIEVSVKHIYISPLRSLSALLSLISYSLASHHHIML